MAPDNTLKSQFLEPMNIASPSHPLLLWVPYSWVVHSWIGNIVF